MDKELVLKNFQTLNTEFATEIPDNHFSDTMNMVRGRSGLWENRKGYQQFGDDVGSGNPIHSLRFWKTSAGARYLTIGSGLDLYSYDEGADYNDGTYTNEKTLTSDEQWDSIVYRDTLVLSNGVDSIQTSTDNDTFTDRAASGTVVLARFLEVANDFVSFSGIIASPSQFYLSSGAPTNPWEYSSANNLNVDIGNSDSITGMKSLGPNIIVTKSRQTYVVDLVNLGRSTLDFGGGCESNRAILQTQLNSVFLAGRQGVFDIKKTQIGSNQLFGNPESGPIKALYDTITDFSTINSIYTFDTNWAIWNAETTLGRLTFVRDLDYSDPVWTYFSGVNALDWTIYEDANGGYHYLFGDGATDRVWEMFSGRNDNGAPIFSRLTSKRFDLGTPGKKKRVAYIDFLGYISENAEWNFELYKDDNQASPFSVGKIDSTNITSNFDLDGLGAQALATVPLGGKLDTATGDISVKPFICRVNIDQDLYRLQWNLWNNQVDARVVFGGCVIHFGDESTDFIDNDFIN